MLQGHAPPAAPALPEDAALPPGAPPGWDPAEVEEQVEGARLFWSLTPPALEGNEEYERALFDDDDEGRVDAMLAAHVLADQPSVTAIR